MNTELQQKIYILENLGCANCAAKMERKIQALPDVKSASITFATRQLKIEAPNPAALEEEMTHICQSIESGVSLVEKGRRASDSTSHDSANPVGSFGNSSGISDASGKNGDRALKGCSNGASKSGRGFFRKHKKELITLISGAVLFAGGVVMSHLFPDDAWFTGGGMLYLINAAVFIVAYILLGYQVLLTAARNIGHGQVFDENFLMSIATIAAFCIGDFAEGVGVMLFYRIGELFEDIAVEKSRSQIMDAVDMRPETVILVSNKCEHNQHKDCDCEHEHHHDHDEHYEHNHNVYCDCDSEQHEHLHFYHDEHAEHLHVHEHNHDTLCGCDYKHHEHESCDCKHEHNTECDCEHDDHVHHAHDHSHDAHCDCGCEHDLHDHSHVQPAIHIIPAEDARPGDVLLVRPGDRIPLDGIVVEGESRIDTSPVTGEPVPISARPGAEVISGCVNEQGVLKIRVTKALEESMVTRILDSVENAAAGKPKIDKFITKFARIYTPIVVALAVLTAVIPSLVTGNWALWIKTAITFLVISCPCALVISVPLAFFSGIGAASKLGILFKGGLAIEALKNVKAIIMDKTGTITKGVFEVDSISSFGDFTESDVLSIAAACESASSHPIAVSIMTKAQQLTAAKDIQNTDADTANHELDADTANHELHEYDKIHSTTIHTHSWNESSMNYESALEEISGMGIKATLSNIAAPCSSESSSHTALCGNRRLMTKFDISLPELSEVTGTEILVALDGNLIGRIIISDKLKEDSTDAIRHLKSMGLIPAMLTGDNMQSASAVASASGISNVRAGLLPEDKVTALKELRHELGAVMFVGDGINDAPVLAGADVGAAMGAGADAAIEAADVVFMNSSLTAIPQAVNIARYTGRIAMQNIIFALAIKLLVIILGLLGFANIWAAVFADTGVAMLCILNSLRVMWKNYR